MNKKKKEQTEPVILTMNIMDDSGFLSPYWAKDPVISDDASDFLDNAVLAFHSRDLPELQIHIICQDYEEKEKELYKQAIANTYTNRLSDLMRQSRRSRQSAYGMLAIGAAMLALNVSLTVFGNRPVMAEIFDCFACAFIWESVDQFWFVRYGLLQEEKRAYALAHAPVSFFRRPIQ